MIRFPAITVLALSVGMSVNAAEQTFNLNFIPDPDPDGFGTGTITINDTTGEISWSITYGNIAQPTAMHIHGPGGSAGNTAGVLVGLVTDGNSVDLLQSSVTTSTANASALLADPSDYYVNIHTTEYGGGAIRSQVPEPSSLVLLGLGGLLIARRRRR